MEKFIGNLIYITAIITVIIMIMKVIIDDIDIIDMNILGLAVLFIFIYILNKKLNKTK